MIPSHPCSSKFYSSNCESRGVSLHKANAILIRVCLNVRMRASSLLYTCVLTHLLHTATGTQLSSGNNLANPLVIIVNKTCVSSQMDIVRLDQRKVTPRTVQFYLISAIASFLLPLKSITENLFSQPLTEVYKGINTHSFLSHFQTVGGFTVFALALSCSKSSLSIYTPIITYATL